MITTHAATANGKTLILIGLNEKDFVTLQKSPLMITGSGLPANVTISIVKGQTDQDIIDSLTRFRLVNADTRIVQEPHELPKADTNETGNQENHG